MKIILTTTLAAVLLSLPSQAQKKGQAAPAQQAPVTEVKEARAKGGKKLAATPGTTASVAALEKKLAAARKHHLELGKVIDTEHVQWEKLENSIEASEKKLAEMKKAMAKEMASQKEMKAAVAKIEQTHDLHHEKEVALKAEIAQMEEALKHEAGKLDEISKLERQAEELKKKAEQLRKRAEELRNK